MQDLIDAVNKALWGFPMLVLLLGCGMYFTVRLGFFQVFKVSDWGFGTLRSIFKKRDKAAGGITPYQALSSALASSIGSGNLVGVATAIASGGAGAVFWMWVASFFGMAIKYAEVFLAVKFRRKRNGEFYGGPMYYIEDGLGQRFKWLAAVFSVAGAAACIGMGGMSQSNSIAGVVTGKLDAPPILIGISLSLITWISVSGGIRRISRMTEKLVPVMALLYMGVCVFVMLGNLRGVAEAFCEIVKSALSPGAACGALGGEMVRRALRFGMARGVFSNEAGLGSSPIVHASANAESDEKQGYWGAFEVFFDTIVMCTMTAVMIISSGKVPSGESGATLVASAFGVHLGGFGDIFVGLSTILFCLSTILGWSYYGESCVGYLTGGNVRVRDAYRGLFALSVLAGACFRSEIIWGISDVFNGIMMVPNLIAVILLSDIVIKKSR